MNEKIKINILECLETHRCALASQILDYVDSENVGNISRPLNQLLEENKISKLFYRGFDFYVITGKESEVKSKIRVIKTHILDVINEYGPIKAKKLVNYVRDKYNSSISTTLTYKLAKELVEDGKLGNMSSLYYDISKSTPYQKCLTCGNNCSPRAIKCPNCNTRLKKKKAIIPGKICQSCGNNCSPRAKICPKCNQNLSKPSFNTISQSCHKCGNECSPRASICPKCQSELTNKN